jgi:hypothetical protein
MCSAARDNSDARRESPEPRPPQTARVTTSSLYGDSYWCSALSSTSSTSALGMSSVLRIRQLGPIRLEDERLPIRQNELPLGLDEGKGHPDPLAPASREEAR